MASPLFDDLDLTLGLRSIKQGEMLYGLGATLADIAKFMQEVEMKFGMDQAAPEKLRKAAEQIQKKSSQLRFVFTLVQL